MKASTFRKYLFLIVIAFVILSCNLPINRNSGNEIKEGLIQNYRVSITADNVEKYTFSPHQQDTLSRLGYPDRFTINFMKMPLNNGEMIDFRQESWYYDTAGYEIVFRNGEVLTEQTGNSISAPGLGKTTYHPEDFMQDILLVELLAVTGETSYFSKNAEDELIKDGQIVFIKGLSALFQNGKLKYVETLPLGSAGQS